MEDPALWGELENVIAAAIHSAAEARGRGVYGLSTTMQVANAVRAAGLVRQEHDADHRTHAARQLAAQAAEVAESQQTMPDPGMGEMVSGLVMQAFRLGQTGDASQGSHDLPELTGAMFTNGASEEPAYCTCGEPVTYYDGRWMHIISEDLRGTGDHTPEAA